MNRKGRTVGASLGLGLSALALMLDGIDNQILGIVMPSLIADWELPRSAFAPFIIVTVLLMSVGTSLGGYLGDRFGRKPVLVGALLLLGIFTAASSIVESPQQLLLLRGLAALGMGGVMPNAGALLSEFASPRNRNLAVSLGLGSIPLGGVLAGLVASVILPVAGWRPMFALAGGITVAVGIAVLLLLKESPKLLAARAQMADATRADPVRLPVSALFGRVYLRDTLALWVALFFSMLGVYSMMNWMPTLLSMHGHDLSVTSLGLAMFNFGGMIAAVIIAVAMDRFGSRRPLVVTGLVGGIVSLLAIPALQSDNSSIAAIILITAMGFCIAGMQVALIALAAQVYPTALRATGMGAMMAVGRLGALASSITGTVVLGFGSSYFLIVMGAAVTISGLSSIVVRTRAGTQRSAQAALAS